MQMVAIIVFGCIWLEIIVEQLRIRFQVIGILFCVLFIVK